MKIKEEILKKAEAITMTKYEKKDGKINLDEICCIIEDLIVMYEQMETKYNELEQNIQDNYIKISVAKQVEG